MSRIHFSDDGLEIQSTYFYTYDIASMKEIDLNLLSRKCIHLIRTTNGNEFEAAKSMLQLVSDEKSFRASKNANDISLRDQETAKLNNKLSGRWSKIAVAAVIFVGLLQAWATLKSTNSSATMSSVDCPKSTSEPRH
jgi:hypothetical protein